MRKLWKALVGILAAVAMLFTGGLMATSASADELQLFAEGEETSYTVSIENTVPGYTYEAYQIFAGDVYVDKDGKKVLSNIEWGSGVTEEGQKALLKQYKATDAADLAAKLTDDMAKDFAQTVASYLSSVKADSKFVPADADSDTPAHYEISDLQAGYYLIKDSVIPEGGAHTEYILQVVGDVSTTPKADVPTMFKKVQDVNDSTGDASDWQDSADYDVNDVVPFQLTATLPLNYASYATYGLRFHDVMSEGLTFNAGFIKVYAVNGENMVELSEDGYRVAMVPDKDLPEGETFNVVIPDLKTITKAAGETSELKIDASTKIVVSYNATLNEHASVGATGNLNEAWLEFSNDPNVGKENSTATTPKDKVRVFTYKLIVNKTDGEQPLAGAAFKLEKKIADKSTDGFHWVEVKTITADDKVTSFNFSGLDDGDYRLTETTTPEGYNTIEPIKFTITAEHEVESDDPQLLKFVITGGFEITQTSKDLSIGIASFDVVNKPGSELPETGGMGTMVLYAAGAVIVIAAALGLTVVLRKRQNAR